MYIKTNDLSFLVQYPDQRQETIADSIYLEHRRLYFLFKSCIDFFIAGTLLLFVLSWLLPLLAILIKIDSKGPVFFTQRRRGLGGHLFTCYKLRTMRVNPQADRLAATVRDTRITRVGKVLRQLNLDELPQCLNILKGDMSLVGPRPHMPADCARFGQLIRTYSFRNLVKPGLTGLAQVKGYHGPAITPDSIRQRYGWDAYYVRHADTRMDLHILVNTLGLALRALRPAALKTFDD